jgi:hypothetical protein
MDESALKTKADSGAMVRQARWWDLQTVHSDSQ